MIIKSWCNRKWLVKVLAVLFTVHCSLFISETQAQDDPEYRMEIGGGLGLMAYQGDLGGGLLKGMQPMVAATAKYKMNPRMAWSAQISTGKLKGTSEDVETWYPVLHDSIASFNSQLTDFTLRYEYNFWPYGTGKEYLGAHRLTPFMALGTGLAFTKKTVAAELLFGVGMKYKLTDRMNFAAEWMMHFTGSDKLDNTVDPYGIKSSGLFKNTDSYSTLMVSLTYDIWAKCKTCHNDRE